MDAYTASVNAVYRLAEVVRSQVALTVTHRLVPQIQRSLDALTDPHLPSRSLLERRNSVFRAHETAHRLDPLSGELLRPRVLAAAEAIDRRLYTRVLHSFPDVLHGADSATLADVQAALFWLSQNGLLEDLQTLAPLLPNELPKPLDSLRNLVLERLRELTETAEKSRDSIAVQEVATPEQPVRFLASTSSGRPLNRELTEDIREKLAEWMDEGVVTPQELSATGSPDTQVLLLRNSTAERLQRTFSGVLLEPDAKLYFQEQPPRSKLRFRVVDGTGRGIPGVSVTLYFENRVTEVTRDVPPLVTDKDGYVTTYPLENERLIAAEIRPRGRYWSKRYTPGQGLEESPVALGSLPESMPDLCWWRRFVGFRGQGAGVKIALIDSGIGLPHPALKHAEGACVRSLGPERWDQDDLGHGTHVAGILCGRNGSGFQGVAPDAELVVFRVSAGKTGEFWGTDLIEAVRRAVSEYGVDIINISAATPKRLVALEAELQDAVDHGVLVVAAAGNQGREEVCYPARFEDVVGVSACGQRGSYPPDSLHVMAESQYLDEDLYVAGFSNHGTGVDICAPGVAIISTVPDGLFGSMDGTSMACPMVAGAAACLLSEEEELQRLRGRDRVLGLKAKLFQGCRKVAGWPDFHQGAGLLHS